MEKLGRETVNICRILHVLTGQLLNVCVLRAAERFVDLTPEERARRRERGWGENVRGSFAYFTHHAFNVHFLPFRSIMITKTHRTEIHISISRKA